MTLEKQLRAYDTAIADLSRQLQSGRGDRQQIRAQIKTAQDFRADVAAKIATKVSRKP